MTDTSLVLSGDRVSQPVLVDMNNLHEYGHIWIIFFSLQVSEKSLPQCVCNSWLLPPTHWKFAV